MGIISCISLVHGFIFSSLYDVLMVNVDLGFVSGSILFFSLSYSLNIDDVEEVEGGQDCSWVHGYF